ncbi:hypothetical protein [Catenovulum agarivorans]|nr:hypothetical protein [Catenovulum agarivorans]
MPLAVLDMTHGETYLVDHALDVVRVMLGLESSATRTTTAY